MKCTYTCRPQQTRYPKAFAEGNSTVHEKRDADPEPFVFPLLVPAIGALLTLFGIGTHV